MADGKAVESYTEVGDGSGIAATPSKKIPQEDGLLTATKTSTSSNVLKSKSGSRKVALVSVKNPPASTANVKILYYQPPMLPHSTSRKTKPILIKRKIHFSVCSLVKV